MDRHSYMDYNIGFHILLNERRIRVEVEEVFKQLLDSLYFKSALIQANKNFLSRDKKSLNFDLILAFLFSNCEMPHIYYHLFDHHLFLYVGLLIHQFHKDPPHHIHLLLNSDYI